MRSGAALLVVFMSLSAETALAQTTGERTAPPTAIDAWQPSTPGDMGAPGARPNAPAGETAPPAQRRTGITSGGTTIVPSITGATFYDDNVFSSNSNRRGDWGFLLRPEIAFVAKSDRSAVEGHAFVEGRQYSKFTSENQINGAASLGGTAMIDPDTQVQGRVGYVRAHEDRGVSESVFTTFDKPVAYNQFTAATALNKRFNRWWTSIGVAGQWINYENPTITGIPIDQSYRNGTISVLTTRVGYVVAPLTSVFAEWAGNHRDFQVNNFDSWGYRVVGGVLLEPGPGTNVRGEAYTGYMNQHYTGPTFQTISTWTYGGSLAWAAAPLTTVTIGGHRDALESGLIFGGSIGVSLLESVVGARVDYRIRPDWLVGVGATYVVDEFKGAGRTDRYLSPLVSVKYFINPNLTAGFDYRNLNFDSSGAGVPTYYRNVYMLSLNAKI